MRIIAPTFLGQHNYPNYDRMRSYIYEQFEEYGDDICLDLEFLHHKEIEPYFDNIFTDIFDKRFSIRSSDKEKMKKILRICKKKVLDFSPIRIKEGYYYVYIIF